MTVDETMPQRAPSMASARRSRRSSRRSRAAATVMAGLLAPLSGLGIGVGSTVMVPGGVALAETVDGQFDATGVIPAGGTLELQVTGRGGVPPSGVGAVTLNIAATNVTASTFLTVWPTGAARPTAASMNVAVGQTLSNMVIAKVGANGSVSIFNYAGSVDVIVDVMGWSPAGGQYTAMSPERLADTRPGFSTIDGQQSGGGPLLGGGVLDVQVTGRGTVPAAGVGAVALNVAATNVTASTYLTVWPSGDVRPTAASMNVAAGQTLSNMVIAKIGANGRVSIYGFAGSADVVVDVMGWFPNGGQYTGLTPARLGDTRVGQPTIDGRSVGGGALGAGATLQVPVVGRGALPSSGVGAVVLNVAITNPSAATFLTVWPTGEVRPTAANMNAVAGQTLSNLVIAKVGSDGTVSIYNLAGAADVVVDVMGWFPAGGHYTGLTPARLADTRSRAVAGPSGPPCSMPGDMTGSLRVQANPAAAAAIAAYPWASATVDGVVQLTRQVFELMGPLGAAIGDPAEKWARSIATKPFPGIDPLTPGGFVTTLLVVFHESVHMLQGSRCLLTGATSGFQIGSTWWGIGPPQSAIDTDVRTRLAALVPTSDSSCRAAAYDVADLYLSPAQATMSAQGFRSQLWEINAYALDGEMANALIAAGIRVPRNTAVRSAKLHQLARYLQAMKTTPGLWDTLRTVGADDIVAAHWNLAVATWRPDGQRGPRDCWTIAFGPDSAVIAEFTGGAAGLTAPPMP